LLAPKRLYASILGITVPPVAAGTLSFFMCHVFSTPAKSIPNHQLSIIHCQSLIVNR
jgi:hypothetical protein